MRNKYKVINNAFIPCALGILTGLLVIANYYFFIFLPFGFNTVRLLRNVAFILPSLVLLLLVSIALSYTFKDKISALFIKWEYTFIFFLVLSFHTVGLSLSRMGTNDFFFICAVLIWTLITFKEKNRTIVWSFLHFLNFFLLVSTLLGILHNGLFYVITVIPLLKAVIVCFLIIDFVRRVEHVYFLMKIVLLITTASALFAIIQEIVYLLTGTILAQIDVKNIELILEPTPFGTFLRVPALTSMHLFLANYLIIGIFICMNCIVYLKSSFSKAERRFLTIALTIMFSALILTFSKTNFLGLLGGVILFLILKWRSKFFHFLILFVVAGVTSYYLGFFDTVTEYFSKARNIGDVGLRAELMKSGIEGFLQSHPIVGVGIDNSKMYTQDIMWGVHNAFLLAADETGILGFIAFCSIFIYLFYRLLSTILLVQAEEEKVILKILLYTFVAYFINIQFQPDFLSYYNWILFGIIESTVITFRKTYGGLQEQAI